MADPDNRFKIRNIWYGVVHRCTNSNHSSFRNYGGRGITLCDRWHSFENFLEDMEKGYRPGLTIGRINNDGPYSPENCKWETQAEQANNRRSSRRFSINGISRTLAEWIKVYNAKPSTVRQRLYVYGWDITDSLSGRRNH
jgi:hypothetical protein